MQALFLYASTSKNIHSIYTSTKNLYGDSPSMKSYGDLDSYQTFYFGSVNIFVDVSSFFISLLQ